MHKDIQATLTVIYVTAANNGLCLCVCSHHFKVWAVHSFIHFNYGSLWHSSL